MNPLLPVEPLVVLFLAAAALSVWASWKSAARCASKFRYLVTGLRLIGLAGLAALALNFGYWKSLPQDERGEWAVLVDSSASMATVDMEGAPRWQRALEVAGQIPELAKDQTVNWFHFDSEMRQVESTKELAAVRPQGDQTDWAGNGTRLVERFQTTGKRLAGIILLTDGRQTPPRSSSEFTLKARALGSPVYPCVLGSAVESKDLGLSMRRLQFVAFKDQPLQLPVRVTVRNFSNIRPVLQLLDGAGQVISEQQVAVRDETALDLRLELKASRPGYARYTLRLKPWPDEATLANNQTEIGVVTLGQKARVLLVEGMPYWDSKFIAQLLQKQANMDLTLIYRLTQDRYFSLTSSGELSGEKALATFPDTFEALAQYDLVVVGKGLEYFLSEAQLDMLKQFVRERGSGLVFTRGKPYSGQWPDLEPLEPIAWDREWSGDFRWQPTVVGEDGGLFSERLPGKDDPLWSKLPALSKAWQGARTKTFAQVLAEGIARVGDREQRFPVVVSQRFGQGMVVVVNSDDLWQWDFFPKFAGASAVYQNFWLQLMHWSLVYSEFLPGHDWSLHLGEQAAGTGQPLRVRASARGKAGTDARPSIRVWGDTNLVRETNLAPVPGQSGQYEAILALDRAGTFRVELQDGNNQALGIFQTLAVKDPPGERDNLSADPEAMRELAASTDGRVINPADLAALLRPSAPEPRPTTENVEWKSYWDRGTWLVLILAAFGAEWFLRRRNGLT